MADAKSDYLERKVLDHALGTATFTKPTNVYVALYTSDPGDAGGGAEVTGGSYARQVATFDAAQTTAGVSTATNSTQLNWTALPASTITHIGIHTAETGGELLYYGPLATSKTVAANDNFSINSGQLTVSEN